MYTRSKQEQLQLEDRIWELLHEYKKPDWHGKYKDAMKQIPIEKQRIWQVFRNYNEALLNMPFLVVKAEADAMKIIASSVDEWFCVWPNYPFAESYKTINGIHYLPPVDKTERMWTYPVWDEYGLEGNCWCKTLFVPGMAKSAELRAIWGNTDFFETGWPYLNRNHFNKFVAKLSALLKYLPWIGLASFIYDPVYYIHICSRQATSVDTLAETLKLNSIPFGYLAKAGHGVYWRENGSLGLGNW